MLCDNCLTAPGAMQHQSTGRTHHLLHICRSSALCREPPLQLFKAAPKGSTVNYQKLAGTDHVKASALRPNKPSASSSSDDEVPRLAALQLSP